MGMDVSMSMCWRDEEQESKMSFTYPGTEVTMTSAPTVPRRMRRTLVQ